MWFVKNLAAYLRYGIEKLFATVTHFCIFINTLDITNKKAFRELPAKGNKNLNMLVRGVLNVFNLHVDPYLR